MSLRTACACLLPALVWACDLPTGSMADDQGLRIELSIHGPGDASYYAPAFARVDRARIEWVTASTARDTLVPVAHDGGGLALRVQLAPAEVLAGSTLRLTLLDPAAALFRGERVLGGQGDNAPTIALAVAPVPHHFRVRPTASIFSDALGDTIAVSVAVIMASGDSIQGLTARRSSSDAGVFTVLPDGRLVTRGNGEASLVLEAEPISGSSAVRVRQVPYELFGVAPADTTIAAGEGYQLRLVGSDRLGHPLLPGSDVSWSATGPVVVSADGRVTATGPGEASISVLGHLAYVTITP